MNKLIILLVVASVACVQLSLCGCTQGDKNRCKEEGCACFREKIPGLSASDSCEDIWDNNFNFQCRRQWMECINRAGCETRGGGK